MHKFSGTLLRRHLKVARIPNNHGPTNSKDGKTMNVPVRLSRISGVAAIVILSSLIVAPLPAQSAPPHGMESPVASQSVEGVEAQVKPLTSTECNLSVCTHLVGGGLYVSTWSTTASNQATNARMLTFSSMAMRS